MKDKNGYLWGWCSLCNAPFIWCPKCGNNDCNGLFGQVNGQKCDECPKVYAYHEQCCKGGTEPKRSDFSLAEIDAAEESKKREKETLSSRPKTIKDGIEIRPDEN